MGWKRAAMFTIVVSPILLISSAGVSAASMTPAPPQVTVQPQSTTVALGRTAKFKARATGFPRPTYEWQVSSGGAAFTNLGVSTSTLSVAGTLAHDGNRYRAVVSNVKGTVDTQAATLTVDQSKYVGVYTLHYTLGPQTRQATLTLEQDGQASDGAVLDIVSWSVSGKTITVFDGNDANESFTFVGPRTSYGIANPKHPGTATLSLNGSPSTGTFYAQRIS
jgi:Immunoglobulin domain